MSINPFAIIGFHAPSMPPRMLYPATLQCFLESSDFTDFRWLIKFPKIVI